MKMLRYSAIALTAIVVASCGGDKAQEVRQEPTPEEIGRQFAAEANELKASADADAEQLFAKFEADLAAGVYTNRQDATAAYCEMSAECDSVQARYQVKADELAGRIAEAKSRLESQPVENNDEDADADENILNQINRPQHGDKPENQAQQMVSALNSALKDISYESSFNELRMFVSVENCRVREDSLSNRMRRLPNRAPNIADMRRDLKSGWGFSKFEGDYFRNSYDLADEYIPDPDVIDMAIDSISTIGDDQWQIWFRLMKGDAASDGFVARYTSKVRMSPYTSTAYDIYDVKFLGLDVTGMEGLAEKIEITRDSEGNTKDILFRNNSDRDVIVFFEYLTQYATKWKKQAVSIPAGGSTRFSNNFIDSEKRIKVVNVIAD